MTAPTYRLFAHHSARRVHLLWWAWEVADGYTGPLLAHGYRLTRRGAQHAAARYAAVCERWEDAQLAAIVARLHEDGIDVSARYDEQRRVCVRPCCEWTTRDEVRTLRAFLAITADVVLEVAR